MINSKMIFRILGFLLLIETAMLLCCGGVSLFYEEGDLKSFLISSALSAGIGVALLPFLLGNVEKYGSAGKTVAGGILTLGGILIGMELLLPAVLGYDRVAAESYQIGRAHV